MRQFVTQIDARPVVWQFLQNLRMDDLVTELVQNELDAGSTKTSITFGRDHFRCEGNGEPIDADGWRRLSFFMGAGGDAPAKRRKTGVKNHGLKACFTIGDRILIRSDGTPPSFDCEASRHKAYLIRRVTWRLQAHAEGDLSERARRRAAELADDAEVRVTPPRGSNVSVPVAIATPSIDSPEVVGDSRLPAPGNFVVRKYKGQNIRVLVLSDGFE